MSTERKCGQILEPPSHACRKRGEVCVITFDDEGAMVVSKWIPASERELLGLNGRKLSKSFSAETKGYLARPPQAFR